MLASMSLQAQIDAQFSQYWSLPTYYNPGSAGSGEKLNILAASRQQWIGMPGAPKTFLISADTPLRFLKRNHGVGLLVSSQTVGLFSTLSIGAQYAFKVKLWGGNLNLGIQLGVLNQTFDESKIFIPDSEGHDPNDAGIPKSADGMQGMAFDMAFGAHYTHKYFYAGLSSTHLTEPTIGLGDQYETYAGRLYYLTAGCNIPFRNPLYELQPSMMVKSTFQITQVELTARLRYNKFLWGGLSYRWKDALIFMIGAEIKNIKFGYSYDYPVSAIVKVSSGSHEVFVGYSLKLDFSDKNKNKHKSIRIL